MSMTLYELEWGLYPRRIGIYLAEKGITDIDRIAFELLAGWPPPELKQLSPLATVPILRTESGMLIRSSIAILEYLEERFPSSDMLGATPELRARTRELVAVIDEAALQFGIWCHKGSPAFAGREEQSREAATIAADAYYGRLRMLDTLASEAPSTFLAGDGVTIADCMAMATLQFAEKLYGVPLPEGCAVLRDWYDMFSQRPSAAAPSYPEPLLAAAQGLPKVCPPTLP
ncbi:glutathione S-transferase family protein [Novosphingobium aquimarinum]|uniref:glutathione S-transferase family protein n=1 Tax=Novosphingobium aquimarinum TaxID=2682494 RepID=UPI0018DEBA67|nr:glutathione S-transferase family protein [Novosphingobium aquimarinum]